MAASIDEKTRIAVTLGTMATVIVFCVGATAPHAAHAGGAWRGGQR